MHLYRALVVDDETFIANSVAALLQCQSRWNMDVCRAFSGEEALALAQNDRIDLLISDIRMGGMDGLELVTRIRVLWPQCQVIMLTAYDSFEYAYRALDLNVAGFVLKTENDEKLLEAVEKAVHLIDAQKNRLDLPERIMQHEINAELLLTLISLDKDPQREKKLLALMGVSESSAEIWLIAGRAGTDPAENERLALSVQAQLSPHAHVLGSCIAGNIFWCLALPLSSAASMLGALELAQENSDLLSRTPLIVAYFSPAQTSVGTLSARMRGKIEEETGEGFIRVLTGKEETTFADPVDTVLRYIDQHLNMDLSISTLSLISGYSTGHLSRLFQKRTGLQISYYIACRKTQQICRLLQSMSCSDVACAMGFNNRSYFNRYVKRMTGHTPQQIHEGKAGYVSPFPIDAL